MGVTFKHRGNFNNLEKFLKSYNPQNIVKILEYYGREGVRALQSATPVASGITANSWAYDIDVSKSSFSISWTNSHTTKTGTPIVILLQYGHGTRQGGLVQGVDFINPAIEPIFNDIAEAVWEEVRAV